MLPLVLTRTTFCAVQPFVVLSSSFSIVPFVGFRAVGSSTVSPGPLLLARASISSDNQ